MVVVVDDEPWMRMMAVDLAEEAGFEVLEAADAEEAVELLEAHSDVRVVFSDVQLPGMSDGVELAACIRSRWPTIGVILTSGHREREEVAISPPSVFLPKPYDRAEVTCLLWKLAQ